jgi:hypothetical protein
LEKESKLLDYVDRTFEKVEAICVKLEEERLKIEEDLKILKENEMKMNDRVSKLLTEN